MIEEIAEIGQRFTAGTHVPVEDGNGSPGLAAINQHVIEFIVVVNQSALFEGGTIFVEPGDQSLHVRIGCCAGFSPSFRPAI